MSPETKSLADQERSRHPTINPKHTHLQIVFTDNSALFFPVNHFDANSAVKQWEDGKPCITVTPDDGSTFSLAIAAIRYMRRVTAEQAAELLRAHNAQVAAQQAEADKARAHNDTMRALQLQGMREQLARGGIITSG